MFNTLEADASASLSGQPRSPGIMLPLLTRGGKTAVLIRAGILIALIALADSRVDVNIPLGFLYLFPMLMIGGVLSRWQIGLAAGLCTVLTEIFDSFQWYSPAGIPRDILIFCAFFGMGLFVYEAARNHKSEVAHSHELELEARARSEAEEQLKVLIESSPAAVFTADATGLILLTNEAARRLFGVDQTSLVGRSIREFLPSLGNVLRNVSSRDDTRPYRTVMQCSGHRSGGGVFLADVWFSTYRTSAGPRLAAMVVDTSEDLRNREELSLHQLLAGSRILVGAMSHEIRNVCGAIAMAHANLSRSQDSSAALIGNRDFAALGDLIVALEKIASMNLREVAGQAAGVDLVALLEEFRIIVGPSLDDRDISLTVDCDPALPPVWADRQSLLQVFLNLTRNSERALLDRPLRELSVEARRAGDRITVHFRDTGCGVQRPELLFRPFQPQAQNTGLGLYLSRAFLRSFHGDLRCEPKDKGATFVVDLSLAVSQSRDEHSANQPLRDTITEEPHDAHPDRPRGRSQPLPREPEPAPRS